jgi:hypothetical protein
LYLFEKGVKKGMISQLLIEDGLMGQYKMKIPIATGNGPKV